MSPYRPHYVHRRLLKKIQDDAVRSRMSGLGRRPVEGFQAIAHLHHPWRRVWVALPELDEPMYSAMVHFRKNGAVGRHYGLLLQHIADLLQHLLPSFASRPIGERASVVLRHARIV